jgi:clan AA aspartic protease (TIGR02281 family)
LIGWAIRQLVIMGAIAFAIYAIVQHYLPTSPTDEPKTAAVTAPAVDAAVSHRGVSPYSMVFRANGQGHVFIDAYVNGTPVRFMVDTGATVVALRMQDAVAAGIGRDSLDFRLRFARAAPVTLREIRIGQMEMDDVRAVVHDNLPMSLLGQSFLTRLDSYQMRDGELTLNWN